MNTVVSDYQRTIDMLIAVHIFRAELTSPANPAAYFVKYPLQNSMVTPERCSSDFNSAYKICEIIAKEKDDTEKTLFTAYVKKFISNRTGHSVTDPSYWLELLMTPMDICLAALAREGINFDKEEK